MTGNSAQASYDTSEVLLLRFVMFACYCSGCAQNAFGEKFYGRLQMLAILVNHRNSSYQIQLGNAKQSSRSYGMNTTLRASWTTFLGLRLDLIGPLL